MLLLNNKNEISNAMIKRLPRYYRLLFTLQKRGVRRVSSKQLGEHMGITPSQIRRDFSYFGGEGLKGSGYRVDILKNKIAIFLGLEIPYNMIIIGTERLSWTLATNKSFEKKGFRIIGIFDINTDAIGRKIGKFEIMNLNNLPLFMKHQNVDIAIVTAPSTTASEIICKVVSFGIKGIWNFSPIEVNVPDDIVIENTCFNDILISLGYHLKNNRQNLG